jgi:hypothetical protein
MTTTAARLGRATPAHGAGGKAGTAVDRMARLGLAARGLVYLLIGWIAVRIALEGSGQQADRQGALREVARHPAGVAVLLAMAVGFAGYALWRTTEVFSGSGEEGAKKWGKRAVSGGRAVLYAVFAASTFHTAMSGRGGSGSDRTSRHATAGVLAHSGGRIAVIAAGAGFVVAGVVMAVRGVLRKFEKKLRTGRMSRRVEKAVAAVGVAGQTARGVVFAVIGGFLINAAASYDPHKARGLDGALRSLGAAPGGKALLVAVAVGLACFGAYSLAEARYRET